MFHVGNFKPRFVLPAWQLLPASGSEFDDLDSSVQRCASFELGTEKRRRDANQQNLSTLCPSVSVLASSSIHVWALPTGQIWASGMEHVVGHGQGFRVHGKQLTKVRFPLSCITVSIIIHICIISISRCLSLRCPCSSAIMASTFLLNIIRVMLKMYSDGSTRGLLLPCSVAICGSKSQRTVGRKQRTWL